MSNIARDDVPPVPLASAVLVAQPTSRRFRKGRRRGLFASVSLIICGLLLWRFVLRGNSLLSDARPVSLLSGESIDELANATWVSPHEYLFERTDDSNLDQQKWLAVFRRDRRTGTVTPLPEAFQQGSRYIDKGFGFEGVSPDRQWACYISGHNSGHEKIFVARLDGSSAHRLATLSVDVVLSGVKWATRGHELAQTTFTVNKRQELEPKELIFVDVERPSAVRRFPIAAPQSFSASYEWRLISSDRLLTCEYATEGSPEGRIDVWQIDGQGVTQIASHSVHFPRGASVLFALVSPNGRYIVWQTHSESSPTFAAWLNHYIPLIPATRITQMVWVCNADGTNLHTLGSLPVKPNSDNDYDLVAENLRWLPDDGKGETLGFRYKNQYYTLSVR